MRNHLPAVQNVAPSLAPTYSSREELFNLITHALGFVFAVFGVVCLLLRADGLIATTSVAIYGTSLMLMFLASSIYHSTQQTKHKRYLKIIDHSSIYLLIAGTYTPFLMVSLSGAWSYVSMALIWSVAIGGVSFKLLAGHKFPKVSLATYLLMGWFIVALIYPLYHAVPSASLWLLLTGGLFFSIGTLFYAAKHKKYTHAIWHLFVIGGCASHFCAIYFYVI